MTPEHAASKLKKEFFQITLAVLGIIQGLSLNQLAEKIVKGDNAVMASSNILCNIHWFLCLMILIRVFQTYLLASLDYSDWQTSFTEVVSIFIVGILEYWVFDALYSDQVMDFNSFHGRICVLLFFAFISHGLAYRRILKGSLGSNSIERKMKNELNLQFYNLSFAGFGSLISFLSWLTSANAAISIVTSTIVTALVTLNISASLHMTLTVHSDDEKNGIQ